MDSTDFEDWFVAHSRWMLRLATALAGPDAAPDVVQEVALRVQRQWSRVAALDHPQAYVRRMIINEHLSWRRRWGRTVPRDVFADIDSGTPDLAEHVADRAVLAAEIRRLPPRQRAVVVLRYLEGLGDTAIAELLGCRPSTVRSYSTRALAALRAQLGEPPPGAGPTSRPAPDSRDQENSHAH